MAVEAEPPDGTSSGGRLGHEKCCRMREATRPAAPVRCTQSRCCWRENGPIHLFAEAATAAGCAAWFVPGGSVLGSAQRGFGPACRRRI